MGGATMLFSKSVAKTSDLDVGDIIEACGDYTISESCTAASCEWDPSSFQCSETNWGSSAHKAVGRWADANSSNGNSTSTNSSNSESIGNSPSTNGANGSNVSLTEPVMDQKVAVQKVCDALAALPKVTVTSAVLSFANTVLSYLTSITIVSVNVKCKQAFQGPMIEKYDPMVVAFPAPAIVPGTANIKGELSYTVKDPESFIKDEEAINATRAMIADVCKVEPQYVIVVLFIISGRRLDNIMDDGFGRQLGDNTTDNTTDNKTKVGASYAVAAGNGYVAPTPAPPTTTPIPFNQPQSDGSIIVTLAMDIVGTSSTLILGDTSGLAAGWTLTIGGNSVTIEELGRRLSAEVRRLEDEILGEAVEVCPAVVGPIAKGTKGVARSHRNPCLGGAVPVCKKQGCNGLGTDDLGQQFSCATAGKSELAMQSICATFRAHCLDASDQAWLNSRPRCAGMIPQHDGTLVSIASGETAGRWR